MQQKKVKLENEFRNLAYQKDQLHKVEIDNLKWVHAQEIEKLIAGNQEKTSLSKQHKIES
jgi:hypothetical protein